MNYKKTSGYMTVDEYLKEALRQLQMPINFDQATMAQLRELAAQAQENGYETWEFGKIVKESMS